MIHTLEARGNVMLQVIKESFNLSDLQVYNEINSMLASLCKALSAKGVSYEKLKPALVPVHGDHQETAFIFDSTKTGTDWYGYTVFESLIPLLNKESTYSILVGDVIADMMGQDQIKELLFQNMIQFNATKYQHSTQYYVVYINNLTKNQISSIVAGLMNKPFFIGHIDMTFNGILKTLFSFSLIHHAIKHKNIVIQGHEPDRDEDEDINMSGYPYERNGFVVKSVSDDYLGVFLSYKVESIFRG